jgi:glycosyltransferase involved in cell wall biosynthesis
MTTKVLQVLGRSAGGIARHVADITQALDGRDGLQVNIAGPSDLPVPMPKPVIEVVIPNGLFGHRRARRELRSAIATVQPTVVHAHGLRAGIDSAVAAKGSGARVIVTVHNLVRPEVAGPVRASAYKPAERLVVRLADRILAVSRDIAATLTANSPDDAGMEIEVLHLGVETTTGATRSREQVRRELGIDEDRPVIVTASRLSAQKALHVMLEAVVHVDATLLIAGEGPLEGELQAEASDLGVGDRVRFLGFRTDVPDLIAAGDVFCLSSVWEGVPLAAMEAAQLGTPIVATDVGGTGELVRDGISGRLVPPGDPQALAEALEDVLSDPEKRARFVTGARSVLDSEFNTDKMLGRLREIYLETER